MLVIQFKSQSIHLPYSKVFELYSWSIVMILTKFFCFFYYNSNLKQVQLNHDQKKLTSKFSQHF